MPTSKP
jgi:chromosome segregation ATPase